MQDIGALVAAVEAEIAKGEQVLAELDHLAETLEGVEVTQDPELMDLCERLEAIGDRVDIELAPPVPEFGVRV